MGVELVGAGGGGPVRDGLETLILPAGPLRNVISSADLQDEGGMLDTFAEWARTERGANGRVGPS